MCVALMGMCVELLTGCENGCQPWQYRKQSAAGLRNALTQAYLYFNDSIANQA